MLKIFKNMFEKYIKLKFAPFLPILTHFGMGTTHYQERASL